MTNGPRGTDNEADRTRLQVALGCGLTGLALVVGLRLGLPDGAADILIDKGGALYPFSVQNGMWIVFCIGLGEVVLRLRVGNFELRQLGRGYLPEDSKTMLRGEDLGPIYRRLGDDTEAQASFLGRLISRGILQFQSSRSVEQTSTLLHSSIDITLHGIDLRYSMLRYIAWLIPSLGFIGTVIGIGSALRWAGDPSHAAAEDLLSHVTQLLGVSFNGTLVALVLAACLAFLTNIAQAREEQALNRAAQYCLDNLINRLYVA